MTGPARRLLPVLAALAVASTLVLLKLASDRRADPAAVSQQQVRKADRSVQPPHLPVPGAQPTPEAALCDVRGRILDHASGRPLAGAEITFHQHRFRRRLEAPVTSWSSSDGTGAFTITEVPCGVALRLRVAMPGYLHDVLEARPPAGAGSFDAGTFRLVRGDWQQKFAGGPRGMVGLDHELRGGRVIVTAVRPTGPAAASGIRPGERIVSVDHRPVDELAIAARTYFLQGSPGTVADLVIEGPDGQRRHVPISRTAAPGAQPVPAFY